MHLSRLAIGSLHSSSTSPRTYAELFWSADRKWSGPLGILSCTVGMFKLRTRVSVTFILFAITCLLAISTPLLLNAAYPHTTVEIESLIMVRPSTASPARMKTVSMYNQLSTGSGQWATGLPTLSMNGGSIYLSDEVEVDEEEMFFAGDSQGMDMSLPGIRLLGSCKVMEDHQNYTLGASLSRFNKLCGIQKMSLDNGTYSISHPMGMNVVIDYQSCFDSDFSNVPPPNSTFYGSSQTFSYPSSSKDGRQFLV
ncbi:hypothetical protein VNI00_017865 [Paramarasmius palmivorus]|uniref:Uncharacterized protein n=1 Tax=Paramarasmius palmivorus TaxID=297713 RepID=A0AAW0B3E5_9AGAR